MLHHRCRQPGRALALLMVLATILLWQFSRPVQSAGAWSFSGAVYVGGLAAPAVGLPGVTVTLWGSTDPASLETQLDTTTSDSNGDFTLNARATWRQYHIVETALSGYAPREAESGSGGEAVSSTWIRYQAPAEGSYVRNLFYNDATTTPTTIPTITSTPTRTPTATATRTATPANMQVLDLCAMADTTLSEAAPGSNYGSDALLAVGYSPANGPRRRILLRFAWPALPAGAVVQSATLRLNLVGASGDASSTVSVYAVDMDWQESTAAWGMQPTIILDAVAQASVGSTSPAQVSWDVTNLAQQWATGLRPNLGLELRGNDSGAWLRAFDSREAPGGACPRLILTVQSGDPISTLTPSLTATASPTATRTPTPSPTTYCVPEFAVGASFADAASFIALNHGSPFSEFICPSGDEDWVKVPASAGDAIAARLDDLPNDYALYLYRPDGAYADFSAGSAYNDELVHTAEQGGEWRVAVRGKTSQTWSSTTPYKLAVSVCPTADEGSASEPGTVTLGQLKSGYICPCGDEDWFAVNIPKAQAVYVHAWLGSQNPDYDLYVYAPDGALRGSRTVAGEISKDVRVPADSTPGLWKVKVAARSASDCSATAPYQVQVTLDTDLDLTVKWIEVTQVTQNYLSNDIDLVLGKPTAARVYVGAGDASGPIEDVAVELTGFWDCLGCTPLPLSPQFLGPRTVSKLLTQQQRLASGGFDFPLPTSWQKAGTLYLSARVYSLNPNQPELKTANNTGSEMVHYVARAPVNVVIVPVTASGLTPAYMSNPQLDTIVSFMQDSYPTSYIQLWLPASGQGIAANYDYTVKGSSGCGPVWNKLLSDLQYYYKHVTGVPAGFVLYGIMDPAVPHGWAGCGSYTARVSAGILGTGDDNLAHEAGHMFGLPHAGCGNPQNPDPNYPPYSNPLGGSFPAASIGEVGVRLNGNMTVFDPGTTYDVMSYCWPKWFSPYNYKNLMGVLPAAAPQLEAIAAESPHLIAIGQVSGGIIELTYPLSIEPMPDSAAHAGEGDYRVEVQDASGAALSSRNFDPSDPYHSSSADEGLFAEVLPYPAGAARVVFSRQGVVQHTVTPSAHAPTVTLTYPRGGETWSASGTYTVTWQAGDADGDTLHSSLFYSRDNGATWNPLASNLASTSYPLDAALLAGGEQALFRVLVTDGLLSASDTTATPLRVPNKAPLVLLLSPAGGNVFAPGQAVVLQGLATDLEDGPLSPEGLRWSSDRDGALGTGSTLTLSTLSRGWHTLTLAASDSAGTQGQATARVLVGDRVWVPLLMKRR